MFLELQLNRYPRAQILTPKFAIDLIPQLGGSLLSVSYRVRAEYAILTPMFDAIRTELKHVPESVGPLKHLEVNTYKASKGAQPFTTVYISGALASDVAKAKAAIGKLLEGHTVKGGKGIVWDEFFLKPEAASYLETLCSQHNIFIYLNARKRLLSLYGSDENKVIVESVLVKAVEELTASTFKLDLDDQVPFTRHLSAFIRISEKLGKSAARLNITSSPKTLTIYGSSKDAEWAKAILLEEYVFQIPSCPFRICVLGCKSRPKSPLRESLFGNSTLTEDGNTDFEIIKVGLG